MAPNDQDSVPEGVDLERPNPARIYDWFLGGHNNWAIDREFGAKAVEILPNVRTMARVGREFLGRGVQYLADQGITQFLDLGSGVPTVGNVHEIADSVNPDSRCVYVDNESVAVAHSRVLLEREGDPTRHAVVQADLLDVDQVWEAALDTGVLDPTKPIGLIVVNVLYFFGPDDDPYGVIRNYVDRLRPGSYLLSSHMTDDGVPAEGEEERAAIRDQYARSSSPLFLRSREEFARFFDGLELVEPGIAWTPEWKPDLRPSPASDEFRAHPEASTGLAGLGRKL
ncbi:O-methyltransferase involved in polyketide biosynthesis [Prauserella isguenensis]|uniref:O-methyltransferase involved in polyketide biosynthesis n=1 Tax=Prauserella isguenensis TaxID=1470180 RepID=A0A839S4Z9_9PSEU|nr:SAM-dependent methyltransferase [Prauserella isguenensis]MBB3051799.1 O-methyltransferase involved in polyketide biosynthesis [Prauserella isguenensis]